MYGVMSFSAAIDVSAGDALVGLYALGVGSVPLQIHKERARVLGVTGTDGRASGRLACCYRRIDFLAGIRCGCGRSEVCRPHQGHAPYQ